MDASASDGNCRETAGECTGAGDDEDSTGGCGVTRHVEYLQVGERRSSTA
jgi:hypothetical protein